MSGSPPRRPEVEELVDAYRANLIAAGMFAGHPVTSVARMLFARVGVDGWALLPLADQCRLPLKERRVVGWLIVTGRVRPTADYLVACRPYLGDVAAHHHRPFHDRFVAASTGTGFNRILTGQQWSSLCKVTALAGVAPEQVTTGVIDDGRHALVAAMGAHRPGTHGPRALGIALFGTRTILFHLGILDAAPTKTNRDCSVGRAAQWASVPTRLAATLTGYIAQVRLSLRPSTTEGIERVLRTFACWLAANAPEVTCVADLRRGHIEAYKLHLAARRTPRGGTVSATTLSVHIGTLRTCFERLTEWDSNDVPASVLVFDGGPWLRRGARVGMVGWDAASPDERDELLRAAAVVDVAGQLAAEQVFLGGDAPMVGTAHQAPHHSDDGRTTGSEREAGPGQQGARVAGVADEPVGAGVDDAVLGALGTQGPGVELAQAAHRPCP